MRNPVIKKIPEEIVDFFKEQGFVIVSTIDKNGCPHSACKGMVRITQSGKVYLLDVYRANTYENLQRNRQISITAIDEHRFKGYCLKGRATTLPHGKFSMLLMKFWEERITSRITQRLLRNIREEAKGSHHPEALLPKPEYLIAMDVTEIVDLTPHHLKKEV